MDILEYGIELENKDYLGTEISDQALSNMLKPSALEQVEEK